MKRRRPRREQQRQRPGIDLESWMPRTRSGQLVKDGTITNLDHFFSNSIKIQDVEIVDILVPNLEESVLDVGRVQRQTDAGRKTIFRATSAVGNHNGLVGLGEGRAAGVGTAIRASIAHAKLNITPVKRGCGSWECTCGEPHTVPFKVEGKTASVRVRLLPAPKGLGLVIGNAAKTVLRLAGIKDVWSRTRGETRTTPNFCKATFDALQATHHIVHPYELSRSE
ncbi:MAG: 30S ribosomal protein S5 [Candidatus Hodarchaeota archaeon]